jgi:hypothetical protein
MSDGMTEASRMSERYEAHEAFYEEIARFLAATPDLAYARLNALAALQRMRRISQKPLPAGLPNEPDASHQFMVDAFDQLCSRLRTRDTTAWASLLQECPTSTYQRLKELSPFAHNTLVFIEKSDSIVSFGHSDVRELLFALLKTVPSGRYVISIPTIDRNAIAFIPAE